MFTGLIEATGTVLAVTPGTGALRITISAPGIAARLNTGDSVSVSGVCLTALDITPTEFHADLAEETIARTTLSRLTPGTIVNLELPTPAGAPLGGHVVQGHVDGTAILLAVTPVTSGEQAHATTDWKLSFQIPSHLVRYVVPKGSIAVEGISLTVASIVGDVVTIAIIPHTYAVTAVHTWLPGTALNIEVDVLAKYAERQAEDHSQSEPASFVLTEAYLLANGY